MFARHDWYQVRHLRLSSQLVATGRPLRPGQGARAVSTKHPQYLLNNPGLLTAGLSGKP